MKIFICLIVLSLSLVYSCGTKECYVLADIRNETNDTILLKLEYDTVYYNRDCKHTRDEILSMPMAEPGIIIVKTDSNKYTKDFLLSPNSCLAVGGGCVNPSLLYSKMKILKKKDSIVIIGRENINNFFKKRGNGGLFRYLIK
jgi:hypothetical protein